MDLQITIVLPIYNGSKYLAQSINSVLSQTYNNFELLIVDDDSNDDSYEIAKIFKDNRIRLLKNETNIGLFASLNFAISEAKNDYIYLWAQDDMMEKNCISNFIDSIKKYPEAGFYYCDSYYIDENNNQIDKDKLFLGVRARTPETSNPKQSALLFFYFGCLPGNISTVLLNKKAWLFCKGFKINKKAAPDFEMWVSIAQYYKICFINRKLVNIREHFGQQSLKSQSDLSSIEEELDLNKKLFYGVREMLTTEEIKNHFLYNRGRQYFHWIMKALIKGNLVKSLRSLQLLKNYGSITHQFFIWLITFNGRYLMLDSFESYDKKISLIK